MTFRRYRKTYIECIFLSTLFIVMLPVTLIFSAIKGTEGEVVLVVSMLGMSAISALVAYYFNDYITIDETGVSCNRKNRLQWNLKWNEIALVKKGIVNKHRGIILYVYNKRGEPEYSFENGGYEFELSKQAKQALALYGKSIENNPEVVI